MSRNLFNSIKVQRPGRNNFNLSHDHKLSCNMGELVPTACIECVPGDYMNVSCEALVRMAPMVAPIMHRCDVLTEWWFVPSRILWPNWEKFISNTVQAGVLPAFPTVTFDAGPSDNWTRLADYLGVPPPQGGFSETVSAMPFAAYQAIYNEYYRDQNLVPQVNYELGDGNNTGSAELFALRTRAWEHDYFTGSLPFAQKGEAVGIPIGFNQDVAVYANRSDTATVDWNNASPADITTVPAEESVGMVDQTSDLYAKTTALENASGSINDLRRAYSLQRFLEKMARAGSRLKEVIYGHFGVNSPDGRLQRPEYITGSKTPINISEVLNTTGTEDAPQGNMAGHGVSYGKGYSKGYKATEHGYILCIMSIRPRTAYQQGIPKMFLHKDDPFQFYWPDFAHIGEQAVLNKEVYAYSANANGTFGYVPRYAEYKFENNKVSGEFRTTLDFWHLGRIFATQPVLNQTFIECVPDPRIFAVTDPEVQHIYAQVVHQIHANRLMPKFGTPI